jgi:hypothetical protein
VGSRTEKQPHLFAHRSASQTEDHLAKGAMALNRSAASGRLVGAELVIDPIGTVFEPLEHSPGSFPISSHFW